MIDFSLSLSRLLHHRSGDLEKIAWAFLYLLFLYHRSGDLEKWALTNWRSVTLHHRSGDLEI